MKTNNDKSKVFSRKNNYKIEITRKKYEKNHIEIGGPKGKEPTRYGDWEKNGRCSDF